MKEKIIELRKSGKSYNEISRLLNCSKSTVAYYCSNGQKEKVLNRTRKRRENILLNKVEKFKQRKQKNNVERIRKFTKRDNNVEGLVNKTIIQEFNWKDVINKFSNNTFCYISGEKINLLIDNYSLDHIIPVSKGGNNSLDNLGITHDIVNKMKSDLLLDEFIFWCKKILENNGYTVKK